MTKFVIYVPSIFYDTPYGRIVLPLITSYTDKKIAQLYIIIIVHTYMFTCSNNIFKITIKTPAA